MIVRLIFMNLPCYGHDVIHKGLGPSLCTTVFCQFLFKCDYVQKNHRFSERVDEAMNYENVTPQIYSRFGLLGIHCSIKISQKYTWLGLQTVQQ